MTYARVEMGELGGKTSVKLRKVAPGDHVWMVKGKHGAWIHPDEVQKHLNKGYRRAQKSNGNIQRNVLPVKKGEEAKRPGFWANKHSGKTIYILGTGTSITPEIGRKLMASGAITIGVNDIFRLVSPVMAPTYHIHADYNRDNPEDQFSVINRAGLELMYKYGTTLLAPLSHKQLPTTDVPSQDFYSDATVGFAADYDVEKGDLRLGHSASSIYHALQLAVILGGSPIILLGVDYYIPKKKVKGKETYGPLHFYKEYHDLERKSQKKYMPQMEKQLEALRKHFERDLNEKAIPVLTEMGVMVFNGSKKSKLSCFQKIDAGAYL